METVLIVIHLMVVVALIGVVLLQRSEGGALGIGGGGGGGGLMSARGAANALTRSTAILAAAFFATSIGLGVVAKINSGPSDILDRIPAQSEPGTAGEGVLDLLGPNDGSTEESTEPAEPETPQIPSGQ